MGDSQETERVTRRQGSSRGWPLLSLFSGAGGLDLGFRSAGFSPELAIDLDPAAVDTYRSNHPRADVVQLDIAKASTEVILDLWKDTVGPVEPVGIIGGPPCQAFSTANVHRKEDDPRRSLLIKHARIIHEFASHFQLEFFVFENIPSLISKHNRVCLEKFQKICSLAGFEVSTGIIDAGSFGIPQRRKRLIVAGVNKKLYPGINIELSDGDKEPTPVRAVLEDLPEPSFCIRGTVQNENCFHPNHVAMVPRSPKFLDGSLKPGNKQGLSFKVLEWDAPSYTVAYGNNEIHVHPRCHRRLSVYEAMLIQGFPGDYRLCGTFTQQVQLVSNAVPPPLGKGIASAIAYTLNYSDPGNVTWPASVQGAYS